MASLRVAGARGSGDGQRSDAALVEAARAGDRQAFGELYDRHRAVVHLAVGDNVRDPDQRADVVQEAFTRALARLDSLTDPERFRPWLLQIARHAAIDARRRRTTTEPDHLDDLATPVRSRDPGPDLLAEVADLAARLESGMARMSPRDATALALAVHFGFGPADIAAALGITVGNAKVVLHRARRRLRAAAGIDALAS